MGHRRIAVACGVAVLCLGSGSCSKSFETSVSGSLQAPVIVFLGTGGRPVRVCVDTIQVYDWDAPPRRPAWSAGGVEADCVWVSSVTYGRAPVGLTTHEPPTPLKPETVYEFQGAGWTRSVPNVPWYGGGMGARVIYRNGAWRPAPY